MYNKTFFFKIFPILFERTPIPLSHVYQLDGSLPANPVNDRRKANAVTLKVLFVYRKISNYSKISDYGTSRKVKSKYLLVKYLLIS